MSLDELGLVAQVPGPITARVREIDGRRVSWLDFDEVKPAAPLTQYMTYTMETAARTALEERIPLVLVINSAGADIAEGIAALDGWGRVARAITDARVSSRPSRSSTARRCRARRCCSGSSTSRS